MSEQVDSRALGTSSEVDLASCEWEAIHIPGAIQPHGAVLGVLADTLLITHASANLAAILDRQEAPVLGRPLSDVIGEAACEALSRATMLRATDPGLIASLLRPDGGVLELRAHLSGRHFCVDIEPVLAGTGHSASVTVVQSMLESFRHAATLRELCDLAVRGLKTVTGYDRVMAYRFHDDGHGEVVAEARAAALEPYLGLHYPAHDVPPQARRLYLRQRVGAIADSSYQPVALLTDPGCDDAIALDLTHSALRSASPVHRQYMRNMKTAASLTVGLPLGEDPAQQTLWGMLVCHHGTPRIAEPDTRAIAGMIGQVVSLLLARFTEAEDYTRRLDRHATMRTLVERLDAAKSLPGALTDAKAELLDLLEARGIAICLSGAINCVGVTPTLPVVEQILAAMVPDSEGAVLAHDDLGLRCPAFACCMAEASGVLLLPLATGAGDAILWFRPELTQTVVWGGNPAADAGSGPVPGRLSPRTSFAAWQQLVSGRSAPWAGADLATAREIGTAVASAAAQLVKADLARLRHYDSLTGLPNRGLLQERLREIERAANRSAALLFLDLDRFKAVNDTMGHAVGDALLIEIAQRLRTVAGPDNMPVRLGGDEFVMLCPRLDRAAVDTIAEQIRLAIEAPFEIAGRRCSISASIGIAISDHAAGLDLVRAADIAMYAAKQSGGNRGVVFEPSLFDRAAAQFEIEQDMREALRGGGEFNLLYQPMFGIAQGTRRLLGFEALVRWRHRRLGWMSPSQFIPSAEKSGLIQPLGDWVLTTALRHGRALRLAGQEANLTMAVNISVLQLPRSGFCTDLAGILEAEGFPPSALCLEVTESIVTNAGATAVLADIRKMGVRVAIDDFGIGYSSLSYLRRLPVDVVKLDRGFLEDVEGDSAGEAFVAAVIALAHAAGKPVVFEGIETKGQFEIVRAAGADMVQGFLFAPPLSASAAEELVHQHRQLGGLRSGSEDSDSGRLGLPGSI